MSAAYEPDVEAIVDRQREIVREVAARYEMAGDAVPGVVREVEARCTELLGRWPWSEDDADEDAKAADRKVRRAVEHVTGQVLLEVLGPDDDTVAAAIDGQAGFIVRTLRDRGMLTGWYPDPDDPTEHPAIGDARGEVAVQLMRSLPRYMIRGTVPLVQWATGITRNVLNEHYRRHGERGEYEGPLDESLVHVLVCAAPGEDPDEDDSDDGYLLRLVERARDRITARPGGIERWNKMLRMCDMDTRGRSAREQLREEMADIANRPVEMFGSETEKDRVKTQVGRPVVVSLEPADDGLFSPVCSNCGRVSSSPEDVPTAMSTVRAHRAWHQQKSTGRSES